MEDKQRGILRNLSLAIIIASIMILIPQFIGLGREGFKDPVLMQQFYFYIETGIGFLVVTALIFTASILMKKTDEKYGRGIAFASQGETPSWSFFSKFSSLQIFFASAIIFSIFGLINFLTNQTVFTGVGSLAQQFTPVDSVIYSSALIPAAENLGAALVIALTFFGLRFFINKKNMDAGVFRVLSFVIIPILVGVYGLTNHLLRYGTSDYNLMTVFLFWTLGGLLTVLIGSFIPFWVAHIANNLFNDLKIFFSHDVVIIFIVSIVIFMIILYSFIYLRRKKVKEVKV
jgi:hypothetical protein